MVLSLLASRSRRQTESGDPQAPATAAVLPWFLSPGFGVRPKSRLAVIPLLRVAPEDVRVFLDRVGDTKEAGSGGVVLIQANSGQGRIAWGEGRSLV